MSYYAYANSGGNSIHTDDDGIYDPDVYGNWMDGSNINLNVVAPNVRVNDINSQAQAQLQYQSQGSGGGDCAPVCEKPKKKYGYKVCKYEIKEVNPCKKKIDYCSDSDSSSDEEFCIKKKKCKKPFFIKPKKRCQRDRYGYDHDHGYHGGRGGYHGGYKGGHGHGGHRRGGGHGGCNTGSCHR